MENPDAGKPETGAAASPDTQIIDWPASDNDENEPPPPNDQARSADVEVRCSEHCRYLQLTLAAA